MALSGTMKAQIIAQNQRFSKDTGSSEVQIALLSADIEQLTIHFQTNKKDHASRRGLLAKLNRRRKLLRYLKRINSQRYGQLLAQLGLRG